jgi:hypothetical protein
MENVELSGPTVGTTLQAGIDEFRGPISGPASAVASLARDYSRAPVIGRFATAAQIGASAVARMSSLFGYSNLIQQDGGRQIVNNPLPDFSSVGMSHPTAKLSLDPKNELTVDSSVLGLDGGDELDISRIVTRQSYVDFFSWFPS